MCLSVFVVVIAMLKFLSVDNWTAPCLSCCFGLKQQVAPPRPQRSRSKGHEVSAEGQGQNDAEIESKDVSIEMKRRIRMGNRIDKRDGRF